MRTALQSIEHNTSGIDLHLAGALDGMVSRQVWTRPGQTDQIPTGMY
ncbi:hypothetical protein [Mycolicibacterium rhodesiae]|nr:hypothetical protein [Mycolicibacterium rhodesiae]